MPASSSASFAGSVSAVDLDVHERLEPAAEDSPGADTDSSSPAASRTVRSTGWITRCRVRPWRFTSIVTESTRNGMSSLTISTTVWVLCQPCWAGVGL